MDFNISEAQKLSSPNPFCLITSCKTGCPTNLTALSWWTYASNHPATLAVFLNQKSYGSLLIKEGGEFGLCITGKSLKEAAFLCGTCSGRNTNKAEKFGIELIYSTLIHPQLIKEHRAAFECKLVQVLPVQDHNLFIGEILAFHGNPQIQALYAMDGYQRLE